MSPAFTLPQPPQQSKQAVRGKATAIQSELNPSKNLKLNNPITSKEPKSNRVPQRSELLSAPWESTWSSGEPRLPRLNDRIRIGDYQMHILFVTWVGCFAEMLISSLKVSPLTPLPLSDPLPWQQVPLLLPWRVLNKWEAGKHQE